MHIIIRVSINNIHYNRELDRNTSVKNETKSLRVITPVIDIIPKKQFINTQ